MKMKALLGYVFSILILAVLVLGLAAPVIAHATNADNPAPVVYVVIRDCKDPPWDPGEERPVTPKPSIAELGKLGSARGNDPWDPGDESDPEVHGV